MWRLERYRRLIRDRDRRGYQRRANAKEPYHEDKGPQRTSHTFLLVRIPWERKPLLARNYKRHVKHNGAFSTRDGIPTPIMFGAVELPHLCLD